MFQLLKFALLGGAFAVALKNKPTEKLAKEMTHDLEMNFNKIAPFGKEDTAKELQDHAAKTQDTLVSIFTRASFRFVFVFIITFRNKL